MLYNVLIGINVVVASQREVRIKTEVPLLTHPGLLHCEWFGTIFLDLEAGEVFFVDLIHFLFDQSLVVVGDDFRFWSVFEADSKGGS